MEATKDRPTQALVRNSDQYSLTPTNEKEASRFAKWYSDSDFASDSYRKKPLNVMMAIQYGYELGLQPMQALDAIIFIKGRKSIAAAYMSALIRQSGKCEYWRSFYDADSDAGVVVTKRTDDEQEVRYEFTRDMAKQAGLIRKGSSWETYPEMMMVHRATGMAARFHYSDVIGGMLTREEAVDLPAEGSHVADELNKDLASGESEHSVEVAYAGEAIVIDEDEEGEEEVAEEEVADTEPEQAEEEDVSGDGDAEKEEAPSDLFGESVSDSVQLLLDDMIAAGLTSGTSQATLSELVLGEKVADASKISDENAKKVSKALACLVEEVPDNALTFVVFCSHSQTRLNTKKAIREAAAAFKDQ